MTNNDLFRFLHGLQTAPNVPGAKFGYARARNLRKVLARCQDLQKTIKPDAAFDAFTKLRIELCKEHAKQDDDGEPVMIPSANGQPDAYDIRDQVAFNRALDMLRAMPEHAAAIIGQEAKLKDFKTLLEEESDYQPYTIPLEQVPDALGSHEQELIFEMIQERE